VARLLGAHLPFRIVTAPPEEFMRFDLAVGRVVAHEVVHLLAPSLPHGRGLMAACADPREFLRPTMEVDPELGLLVQTAARSAVAPASRGSRAEPTLVAIR
jgi:hypothetical protein